VRVHPRGGEPRPQDAAFDGYVTDRHDGLAVEAKAIRKYLQSTLEHLVAPR
jgi:hypothetical protein